MWYEINLDDFYCRLVDFVKLIARTNIKQVIYKRIEPNMNNQFVQLSLGYRTDMSEFINGEKRIRNLYFCLEKIPEKPDLMRALFKIHMLKFPGKMIIDINKYYVTSFITKINIYAWVHSVHNSIYCKLIDADVGQNTVAYSKGHNIIEFVPFYHDQIINIMNVIKLTLERS